MQSDEQVNPVRPPSRSSTAARGRRAVLAVVGALIGLLLSGCLNYSANVAVSADDQVSGAVILTRDTKPMGGVEVLPAPAPLPSGAPGSNTSNKIEFPKPVSTTDSIVVTPYSDGTNVGYKIVYKRATFKEAAAFTPLGDRGGALVFTRDGDTVKFAATFDLSFDAGTAAQKALLAKNVAATVKLDLPGKIGDSNGTVADTAITWTIEPLKVNDLTATYESAAPAAPTASTSATATSAPTKGVSTTTWIIIGAVVLGLLVIGGATFGVLRRRRSRRDAGKAATSEFEPRRGPDAPTGSVAPYGPVQHTYPPPHTPTPAMPIPPQFGAPSSPQQFAPQTTAPQTAEPQAAEPQASDPWNEQPEEASTEAEPNERTTTYAVAEEKSEHREPAPESPVDVAESSAMITETPHSNAPALRGGWPPPRPKWKQEP